MNLSWDRFVRLNFVANTIRENVVPAVRLLDAGSYDGALALFLPEHEIDIVDPAQLFNVSDFDVLAALKEVMQNNIEDRWWVQKSFDDTQDEGNMKAKYVVTYEEELKAKPPVQLKRQLILDIKVSKVASQTSVKLNYQVASEKMRWAANDVLEKTTAMIWTRLNRLAAAKGATPS